MSNQETKFLTLRSRAETLLGQSEYSQTDLPHKDVQSLIHDLSVHQIQLEMQNDELQRAQQEILQVRDEYLKLYNHAPTGFISLDACGVILKHNQTFAAMLGDVGVVAVGMSLGTFMSSEDRDIFLARYKAFYKSPQDKSITVRLRRTDGSMLWVHMSGRLDTHLSDSRRNKEILLLTLSDINSEKLAGEELKEEQLKFQTIVECLGDGIAIRDLDYRIIHQNRAMTEMFGNFTGSPCYGIFGLDTNCPDCITLQALNDGQTHSSFCSYQSSGTTFHIEKTASLLRDAAGIVTGSVAIFRDISERIIKEQIITDLAFHDPLTGLSNRRLFEDRLAQTIAKSRRYGTQFGLLYLDLDHFKEVNDTLGHDVGDMVLIEAAERIKSCCKRDLDTISRHGGDEFCIVITDCGGRENLISIAENLLEQFARPFLITGNLIEVTTSIGISIFPDNGLAIKELEIASDRAMYAAKKAGRNTYCFWEPL